MAKKESKKEREQRVSRILAALDREYGTEYRCYLNHETPWQLLIAVILSAQCTDARVNIVTADLFKKYDTLEKFADANLKELEQDIHSIGFYHMKAKNIISCCKDLVEKYGGIVPEDINDLTSLAGVGRKTANVIRGNIYNEPSIVVDTHVKRISRKLGLTCGGRSGKDRVQSDGSSAKGSLDFVEHPYYYAGTDYLYSQKPEVQGMFFKG